ncbi:serine/threonine protein kinase [Anatilimnocola floriformis]|uniref:serine/threonine protein kinase n=1 Tax=Anatilimnocola floriformis TaxID=2948575 RepID=UPI0020C3B074|nr:protein kinase [Anatilimnocola floriformis]
MPSLLRGPARVSSPLPAVSGYELVRLLSSGNWFQLFQARAAGQGSAADYVIKRLRDNGGMPRAILLREAQVTNSVSHENLVSLLGEGLGETTPYIVLPFLPGMSLEQARQSPGQTSVPQALWYIRQVAAALAELHAAGWIHSDLKPSNIIASETGHATLIDLGLARRLGTAECHADRWLAGDANYLAPEVFQPNRELTGAADIYPLGLVLLRLLQGAKGNPQEPVELRRTLSDLRSYRPDVSRDVAHLLGRMLAQEPLRRPAANELVEIISRLEIESLMQW